MVCLLHSDKNMNILVLVTRAVAVTLDVATKVFLFFSYSDVATHSHHFGERKVAASLSPDEFLTPLTPTHP